MEVEQEHAPILKGRVGIRFLAIPVVVFILILSGRSISPKLDLESPEADSDPPFELTSDEASQVYERLRGQLDRPRLDRPGGNRRA